MLWMIFFITICKFYMQLRNFAVNYFFSIIFKVALNILINTRAFQEFNVYEEEIIVFRLFFKSQILKKYSLQIMGQKQPFYCFKLKGKLKFHKTLIEKEMHREGQGHMQWWIFQFRGPRQEFSKIDVV